MKMEIVEKKSGGGPLCGYLYTHLSSLPSCPAVKFNHQRKGTTAHDISYLSPLKFFQVFLPRLFSPATQPVLIFGLCKKCFSSLDLRFPP